MNLTSEVVLPSPLDSHSPLQIHVKTNRPFKASAGFEVIESLSLSLGFPSSFSHSTKLTTMHCLQASLMSADFFLLSWLYWTMCTLALRFAHNLLLALDGSPIASQSQKERGGGGYFALFFSYLFICCDFVYDNYSTTMFFNYLLIFTIIYYGLS